MRPACWCRITWRSAWCGGWSERVAACASDADGTARTCRQLRRPVAILLAVLLAANALAQPAGCEAASRRQRAVCDPGGRAAGAGQRARRCDHPALRSRLDDGRQGRRQAAGALREVRGAMEPGAPGQEDRDQGRARALRAGRGVVQDAAGRRRLSAVGRPDGNRRFRRRLRAGSARAGRRRAGPGRTRRQAGPAERGRRAAAVPQQALQQAASRRRPIDRSWCCTSRARAGTSWSWPCG